MKIAVVTDSTADLSDQETQENKITVVPAILVVDGKEFLDGKGMSREDYYDMMPTLTPPPTTSAPSSGMFADAYQNLFQNGVDHIVSIHVASTLSGIVNAAKVAADSFGEERVTLIDSGQLSMGLGFQVLAAAKAALEGQVESVLDAIEDLRSRIQVIAMIDSLEQLKKSGRVSWLKSSLGSLLRIKLFLEVAEGSVLRLGEARTRGKAIQRMVEMLQSVGPLEQLAVLHTNAL
ncbi:MAG TPA: DegV family protein, partial [Anaerolineales bacterium]|nr:DegV family protein [Anaerolineales bacterium]